MALRLVTGFGHRTTAGWVTGNAGLRFADAVAATPVISLVDGRTWLDVDTTAASENLRWDTNTLAAAQTRLLLAFRLRFPTTVPTVQILTQVVLAAGLSPLLLVNASDQLVAGFETGNTVTGPTLLPDTDYWVELHVDLSANPHVLDWWVDDVPQSQVTQGQAASTVATLNLGTTNPETYRALYSDVLVWTDTADITAPVGPHKVVELSVDPAGTFVLTGTATNWNVFTGATPTLAAWNATTARDRVDEIPANIGAAQDGFTQIAIAAGDFVRMPMTTYTLQAGETVTGLRAEVVGWAASTTATNIRFDDYNGTSAATFFALGDPNFDNSATVPAWVCAMLTQSRYDLQAELDGFCIDVGYGTDGNPDVGIHAAYAALAVKLAPPAGPAGLPTVVAPPPRMHR